jgi:hypothetical protein
MEPWRRPISVALSDKPARQRRLLVTCIAASLTYLILYWLTLVHAVCGARKALQ